jgi:hypothetical protein
LQATGNRDREDGIKGFERKGPLYPDPNALEPETGYFESDSAV